MTLPLIMALRNASTPHDNLTGIAADEIERLRRDKDDLCGWVAQLEEETESLRTSNKEMLAALNGMLTEWDKLTRYGSPMAKAGNERVNAARAAIEKAEGHE